MHRALLAALAINLLMFTAGQVSAEDQAVGETGQDTQSISEDRQIPADPNQDNPSNAEDQNTPSPPETRQGELDIPKAKTETFSITLPGRGMTMEQVEARFGTPQQKKGPVGTPPISTWVYKRFSVYFEGRYVIHAVFDKPE